LLQHESQISGGSQALKKVGPKPNRKKKLKPLVFCLAVHHQLGKVIEMNQLDSTVVY